MLVGAQPTNASLGGRLFDELYARGGRLPARTFTASTSDKVTLPTTPFNTLAVIQILTWVYPTSFVGNGGIICKKPSGVGWSMFLNGTAGNIEFQRNRNSSPNSYVTNNTPLALNRWCCIAARQDNTQSSVMRILTARHGHPLAPATYSAAGNGSGTNSDDSSKPLLIGNTRDDQSNGFPGGIGLVILWNHIVSDGDLQACAYEPWNGVADDALGVWYPGIKYGRVPDWSGHGNHSVSITGTKLG